MEYVMVLIDNLHFICCDVKNKNKHIFSVLAHLYSSWFFFRRNRVNV